jgi:RNAse (barnase) inhibitor barstar
LFDYYLALFLHFKYKLLKDLINLNWLFEKSKNEDFAKIIDKIGYKREVIQNLFSLYDKITGKTTFIYLEAAKKGFKKKVSFSEDKGINLDSLQDYFSKIVGGSKK